MVEAPASGRLALAAAPVTWGAWGPPDERDLPDPGGLLEEVRRLGYRAIELGSRGYLGGDATEVIARLRPHGLDLAGGFVALHLADESAFRADLAELDATLEILAGVPTGGIAVLSDAETPERVAASGRPAELHRTALSREAFRRALGRLDLACERCAERGVRAAFHPHTGTYVESPHEIEALLELSEVAFCLDTGHVAVGGGDPLALARTCGHRLGHLHVKDVDGALLARLRSGLIDVEAALEAGLFCRFGRGEVDLAGFLALPEVRGFDGWLVLEQDRFSVPPTQLVSVRTAEEANLRFVRGALAAQP